MAHTPEVRELAFKTWYACGLVDEKASALLESEHDRIITRQTIAEWRKKYDWDSRAAKIDAIKQEAADTQLSFDEELLRDLRRQKELYERYFEHVEKAGLDSENINQYNQTLYAYTTVVKELRAINKEVQAKAPKRKAAERKGISQDDVKKIRKELLGLKDEQHESD